MKVYCVDGARRVELARGRRCRSRSARGATATTSAGSPTRVAPFDPRRRGGGEIIVDRRELRRLPRGELRAQARRPLPARDLHERRLRRRRSSAGASAATPSTSTTRWTTSQHLARRPPRLAALARVAPARLRAGPVGGHDRRARVDEAVRRRCSARRGSATSSTSGATTCRTTGRRGARRSRIICPALSDARC